jgi:hypothetical protein
MPKVVQPQVLGQTGRADRMLEEALDPRMRAAAHQASQLD